MSYKIKNYNKDSIYLSITNLIQSLVFQRIGEERLRQDKNWGIQNHSNEIWLSILIEELGEVIKNSNELRESKITKYHYWYKNQIKKELIQVAAVAVAWLEDLERSKK